MRGKAQAAVSALCSVSRVRLEPLMLSKKLSMSVLIIALNLTIDGQRLCVGVEGRSVNFDLELADHAHRINVVLQLTWRKETGPHYW